MPPPPPPANVYPCLDWVPRGVARRKPERLKLTSEELRDIIADAKSRALEARKRLGQAMRGERTSDACAPADDDEDTVQRQTTSGATSNQPNSVDADDDVIMREYGLENYEDEDRENTASSHGGDHDVSEDDEEVTGTRGRLGPLVSDLGTMTYHASNEEDPYLRGSGNHNIDDAEEEEELIIKPTDNLIVAGHVNREESSIEVYVYDSETNEFYLHHDIIQSDYPCCVRWIGHARGKARNLAAAGYMSPEICLWDLDVIDVLEPYETLTGHKDAVIDICWHQDIKNIIASGSADKHVRLWNLDECKSISNIKLSGKVSAIEFSPNEHALLLAGDLNRHVSLIDTRTNKTTHAWELGGEVERVRWLPHDDSKFLVSDDQGYIYYHDLRQVSSDGRANLKFRAHKISVTGLEFSPMCQDMLVTASADDTIKVWDIKTFQTNNGKSTSCNQPTLVKEVTDLKVGSILSLKMCPNAPAMIAVGGDSKCNSFKTYDLSTEREGKCFYLKSDLS